MSRAFCQQAMTWLRGHKGAGILSRLTGQDAAAWQAFVHAVMLWGVADDAGRPHAIDVMRACVRAMQPKVRHLARDVIPYFLDWGDIARLWPQIDPDLPVVDEHSPPEAVAAAKTRAGGAM